jgi:hypothetical protein
MTCRVALSSALLSASLMLSRFCFCLSPPVTTPPLAAPSMMPMCTFDCTTQGDDEHASKLNFTNCPIKDYRPLIKELITQPPYLDMLVYSGDVDAQIPHTATEAWTS